MSSAGSLEARILPRIRVHHRAFFPSRGTRRARQWPVVASHAILERAWSASPISLTRAFRPASKSLQNTIFVVVLHTAHTQTHTHTPTHTRANKPKKKKSQLGLRRSHTYTYWKGYKSSTIVSPADNATIQSLPLLFVLLCIVQTRIRRTAYFVRTSDL